LASPPSGGHDLAIGRIDAAREILLAVDAAYLVLAIAYLRTSAAAPLYFFLGGDALFLTAILSLDPRTFAFADPLLFVVVVRTGIDYGLRATYLSWSAALVGSLLFFVDPSWSGRVELALTFFVALALVPVFFASLFRRIHALGTIEEERARLAAINDAVAARSAFLARVGHELRSPLQGIVSALDVLTLRQGRGQARTTSCCSASAARRSSSTRTCATCGRSPRATPGTSSCVPSRSTRSSSSPTRCGSTRS
jgi:signal transduction histidine kinase